MINAAITTRNRPDCLELCLVHFLHFSTKISNIIIIDDNSEDRKTNEDIVSKYLHKKINIHYHYNEARLGIAKSKNVCLKKMLELQTEHFFLFDDDCFPKKEGWEDCFISAAKNSNVHHLMFLVPFSIIQPIKTLSYITGYNNCAGVMLYLDRQVIDKVGAYDPRFGLYGYEHAQYSHRIFKAGLTGQYIYNTPNGVDSYIYALDISLGWLNEAPPLGAFNRALYSSVTQQEALTASKYGTLMSNSPIYIPFS